MATDMIDTIHDSVAHIPRAARKVAGYDTGSADVMWTVSDWQRFLDAGKVHINQSGRVGIGQVLDVEFRAATDISAHDWALWRQASGKRANFYISIGDPVARTGLYDLVPYLSGHGVDVSPKGAAFWVAWWALSRDGAAAKLGKLVVAGHPVEVVAIQWASPSSNPHTTLPGTSLTLVEANCDLSVTRDGWYAPTQPPAPPQPPIEGFTVYPSALGSGLTGRATTSTDGGATFH